MSSGGYPPDRPGDHPNRGAQRGPDPRVARARHAAQGKKTIHRRRFLAGALGLGGIAAIAAGADWAANSGGSAGQAQGKTPARAKRPTSSDSAVFVEKTPNGVEVPKARWLIQENAKRGDLGWVVTSVQTPHTIEGFANQVSAVPGDELILYVNTTAPAFHVEVYRMGFYQGLGGRLITRSAEVPGIQQAAASFTPGINMIECQWKPSAAIKVDRSWPPGSYLLKLVGDRTSGEAVPQQYVPLCIRDDSSIAAYVFQNSVTTWQAYNLWGNYSLYYGQSSSGGSDFADRSRVVSFDRPYPQTWAQGSADFFGNEFPVLYHMESLGLDMTYWTDVDLHARPQLLAKHRCLMSMGHDEYWSTSMRSGTQNALNRGTNLAFLGANACYRHIRFQPSPFGPNRYQVCYKDASEDPMNGVDNAQVTVNWQDPPLNDPESTLIGDMYQSVGANSDLVITDASSWAFAGCNLTDGQHLAMGVQGEFDRYVPSYPGPRNLDVLAHSPITNQGSSNWSDISYYTLKGGGGVFASGSANFVGKLSNTTAFPTNIVPAAIPGVTDYLLRAMENVYGALGRVPASESQPSSGNWSSVYTGSSATAGSAQGTPTA